MTTTGPTAHADARARLAAIPMPPRRGPAMTQFVYQEIGRLRSTPPEALAAALARVPEPKRAGARHEGAHLALALAFGLDIIRAEIDDNGGGAVWLTGLRTLTPREWGAVACVGKLTNPGGPMSPDDAASLTDSAFAACRTGGMVKTHMHEARRYAGQLLHSYRRSADALALLLARFGAIGGDEAETLFALTCEPFPTHPYQEHHR